MKEFPRVLVCCPTADVKNYAFEKWITNVMNFRYSNFEVRLLDNSDDGLNSKFLNDWYERLFFEKAGDKFEAINCSKKSKNVIEKLCVSHNDCRDYMLSKDYDYMLHLESDIMPDIDIIESLMFHQKRVVGCVYHTDEGLHRKAMLQRPIHFGNNTFSSMNFSANEELFFMDGTLKKITAMGLGCMLIKRNVMEKIKFRFIEEIDNFPDSYFAEDCTRNGINIYADTSKLATHENTLWLSQV
jgi:hypothetical protein